MSLEAVMSSLASATPLIMHSATRAAAAVANTVGGSAGSALRGLMMTPGYSAKAAPRNEAMALYGKMVEKLISLGCWTGKGRSSIEQAFKQGSINMQQYLRYRRINSLANQGRHSKIFPTLP
jgi:hypothetical protein